MRPFADIAIRLLAPASPSLRSPGEGRASARPPGKGCPNPCKARPIGRRNRFQRKERKGGRAFAFLALESWRSLRRAYSTGQGVMCQISLAYSAMVRSVLNLPELAMFIRHMRAQREGCS